MSDGTSIAARLAAYLAARPVRPFDWRHNNCCHFAAQWVHQATGFDPLAGLPATPDARRAVKLVRRMGGTLASAWTLQLGRAPILASLAQTGDLVLMVDPAESRRGGGTGHLVGICSGRHAVVLDETGAHAFLPMREAICAWRLQEAV